MDPLESSVNGDFKWRYVRRHPSRAFKQALTRVRFGAERLRRETASLPPEMAGILSQYDEAATNSGCTNLHSYGGHDQGKRVAALAEWSSAQHPGDIVEIGANRGLTTQLLAAVAQRHGRKVIAIDPWITGTQNCSGGEYKDFLNNIAPFRDAVDIWKVSSLAAETFQRMQTRALAFAFVDGLHTFAACMSDFWLVRQTRGLIVADDARYNREVALAVRVSARRLGRHAVQLPHLREAFLV